MKQTETIGMWFQTWDAGNNLPEGINLGIAYSGWPDLASALRDSDPIFETLPQSKILTLGGGADTGNWTADILNTNTQSINEGLLPLGYDGVMFDIEQGDAGLLEAFEQCFASIKQIGKKVYVGVSHSGPYGFPDTETLMTGIFASNNIDGLSPMLYSAPTPPYSNNYDAGGGIAWAQWQTTSIPIIPSIPIASLYPDAQQWFKDNLNITLDGFIQWVNIKN